MSHDSPEDAHDIPTDSADPVARRMGESRTTDGTIPERPDDLSTTSYRGLTDDALWNEITRVRPSVIIGVKPPQAPRGVFRGRSLTTDDDLAQALAEIAGINGVRRTDGRPRDHEPVRMLNGRPYPAITTDLADIRALSELRRLLSSTTSNLSTSSTASAARCPPTRPTWPTRPSAPTPPTSRPTTSPGTSGTWESRTPGPCSRTPRA